MKIATYIYKMIAFDKLSLFQISFSYVLVLILSPDLINFIYEISFGSFGSFLLFLSVGMPFIFGLLYSIKHIFSAKRKTKRELWLMISSATVINLMISYYTLKHGETVNNYYLIFPIINIIQASLILLFLGVMSKDDEIITIFFLEGNVKRTDAIINLILLSLLILFFHFYLHAEWYYTISSAITWNIIVSKFLKTTKKI